MQKVIGKVKTKDAGPWDVELYLPDSIDELVEVYGKDGALYLANAGLKVKQQNIARDILAKDPTQFDEASKAAREYRPGGPGKQSNMQKAFELIQDKAADINGNDELKAKIRNFIKEKNFKGIIEALGEEPAIEGNEEIED